jgi:1A family penicillin-binding protein
MDPQRARDQIDAALRRAAAWWAEQHRRLAPLWAALLTWLEAGWTSLRRAVRALWSWLLRQFSTARASASRLVARLREEWPAVARRHAALVERTGLWLRERGERLAAGGVRFGSWLRARQAVFMERSRLGAERLSRRAGTLRPTAEAQALRVAPALADAARRSGGAICSAASRVRPHLKPRPAHLIFAAGAFFIGFTLLYNTCGLAGCPDVARLSVYQPGGAPALLDRNGEKFADLAPFERMVVALDSLPPHVSAAFIAVEDRRFFEHHGVDWVRVFGAALANVRARRVTQGSSTISMQLARNVFPRELPGNERTWRRKLLEARVAQEIEEHYTKAEILELYLNHIYFGSGAYGIEAAARRHFGKPAAELEVAEAAMLAALPKAPSHYDPRRHPERARERRDLVLSLMRDQQWIDSTAAAGALAADVDVPAERPADRSGVPLGAYFIDVVRDQLDAQFGEKIYRTGLRIHTTLDATAQRAAERELESRLTQLDRQVRAGDGPLQGAVVVMEAASGEVLALVGGRDPMVSRYNRALLAQRQVGSAFKPFVYAAAVKRGYAPSEVIMDAPYQLRLSRNDVWRPGNYDGRYDGPISMRDALVRSRNVPTVRLAEEIGLAEVVSTARAAGITGRLDETPALSLGTPSLTPLQMASAYTTFATLGTPSKPRFVLRVEDEHGNVLWEPAREATTRTLSPAVAYIVNDMLRDAVDRGTGTGVRVAGFRGAVAGKTGTTNDATDAWFVGYTTDYVGAVWIGYDRPSSLGNAATGGGFAAPVWGRVMGDVYNGRGAPEGWTRPENVIVRTVDPQSGLILANGCYARYGQATSELFIAGFEPGTVCPTTGNWLADLWRDFRQGGGRTFEQEQRDRERELVMRRRGRGAPPPDRGPPPGRGNQRGRG